MASEELLRSWNDGPAREALVGLVAAVSTEGAASYLPGPARVAVFDNDGTLWTEKPLPIQLDFTIFRLAELAAADPSLRSKQPYKAAAERDLRWFGDAMTKHYRGDDSDLHLLMEGVESAFDGMSVEAFVGEVRTWFGSARHPTLGRTYASCAFAPMVELLRYLEANDFHTFIASGGDRDFMRCVAEELYGVPPERVIGSALGLEFHADEHDNALLYKSKMEFFDDGNEKPVRIWSRIGRRPVVAGGNSNGDVPMLRFAHVAERPVLQLLVLHDDPDREFDYRAGAEDALSRAASRGWTVVSVKDDWSTVFAGV
jgi:phosphoserine phosphatase